MIKGSKYFNFMKYLWHMPPFIYLKSKAEEQSRYRLSPYHFRTINANKTKD